MRRGNLQDFGANVMYEISNDGKQTRRKYCVRTEKPLRQFLSQLKPHLFWPLPPYFLTDYLLHFLHLEQGHFHKNQWKLSLSASEESGN